MTKRILGAALALIAALGLATAARAATPAPRPAPLPLGLRADAEDTPTCLSDGVCAIVKDTNSADPSCTGFSSQTTPPSTIRVLVHSVDPRTKARTYAIKNIDFKTYVQNVLPNEWLASWDGDARKAGAVAVKSYAWYWVNHFGGYLKANDQCFDVTDDFLFQVYEADTATAPTNSSIDQTWPVVARKDGQVFQASFQRTLTGSTAEACGAGANGSILSQYGSQNCNDPDLGHGGNTANKYNVILQKYYGSSLQLATTAQLRAQHDFQYLRRSTPATFNAGTWSIGDGYPTTIRFGLTGDVPVVNTVGDGFARVGTYRPSNRTWYLGGPTGLPVRTSFRFGLAGDVPVAGQYQGLDAPTQVAMWRPSNGTWYFAGPTGGTASTVQYGLRGDVPVPGRWLSASADSIAVYRPSAGTWYVRGASSVRYGEKGDIPVPADYTGDGRTDIAVYRPSTREFYLRGQAAVHWGLAGDVPVTGDFTGDGKADLAVYRPSNHTVYVRGGSTIAVGSSGATPIGKTPYGV